MQKKDYELVAAQFKREVILVTLLESGSDIRRSATQSVENLVIGLAMEFKKDNPRFDEEKFYTACGLVFNDRYKTWDVPV